MKKFSTLLFVLFLSIASNTQLKSYGEPTWLINTLDNPSPGYLNFDWEMNYTFLVDNYGKIQYKDSALNGLGHFRKFLKNGNWMTIGLKNYYVFDHNMQLIDSIPFPKSYYVEFHEFDILSNGHYLILCIQIREMDLSSIPGGSKTAQVFGNVLIETDRTGKIYWNWNSFDHYKLSDATEDINFTQEAIDWTHFNSFAEDSDGNILVSVRHFDEITKIDKKTGDIIWRLGGSMCKNNQFTFIDDDFKGFTGFSHQHSISCLANGNILMYDNGNLKTPQVSRTVEYEIDQINKTAKKVWEYKDVMNSYQSSMGSAYRLANGNTIINSGYGKVTEVRPNKQIAFELEFDMPTPLYRVNRCITRMQATFNDINKIGQYVFSNEMYDTGVTLDIDSLVGSSLVSIERHNYAPPVGTFQDSNFKYILPYRWVMNQSGISKVHGLLRINAFTLKNLTKPERVSLYKRDNENTSIFKNVPIVFNPESFEFTADINSFGEFVLVSNNIPIPTLREPANFATRVSVSGTFDWNPVKDAVFYHIQVSDTSTFVNPIIDSYTPRNDFDFKDLLPGTKYYWRVSSNNEIDTSSWSEEYVFKTAEPISVIDLSNFESLAYPNPVKSILTLDDNHLGKYFALYNQLGSKQLDGFLHNNSIDLSELPCGIYLLVIDGYTMKIVKE
jgi:hypothetical protein